MFPTSLSTFAKAAATAAGFLVAALATTPALAETQTFKNPKAWGKAVSWCLEQGGPCGAVSADLFCQTKNFTSAKNFSAADAKEPSVYLNNGEICTAAECKILTSVTCVKDGNSSVNAGVDLGAESGNSAVQLTYTEGESAGDASLVKLPEGFGGKYGIFVRGLDDVLWMNTGDGNNKWNGWQSTGHETAFSPSCAFVPIGAFAVGKSVFCAVVTKSNSIKLIDMMSGKAMNLDGKTKFAPSLVYGYHSDGRRALFLFVRANDGQLAVKQFIPSDGKNKGAQPWKGLGTKMSGAPTCLWMGNNHFDCYFRDGQDNTMEATLVLQGGQVYNLEGKTKKRLGPILTDKKSQVRVLVKGLDNKLWVRNWTAATGFKAWKQVPQVDLNSQPVCLETSVNPRRMTCIDVAADNKINALNFDMGLID
jgi:hypothetical protein